MKKFIVGKIYRYDELPDDSDDDQIFTEHGPDYIGQNAIHIRYEKSETDVWFIWHSYGNQANYKCVYNSSNHD